MTTHHATCWREHHACAIRRVEELERDLATIGSAYETWREVIEALRRRIARLVEGRAA